MVATLARPPQMSGDEPCWGVATAALVRLHPDVAAAAIQSRKADFFHRCNVTDELRAIAADVGPAQPIAFQFLKDLNPNDDTVKLSVAAAVRLLAGDSAVDRRRGAEALRYAVLNKADRPTVLGLLRPHLMGTSGPARLPFVQAYGYWASRRAAPVLAAVVGCPAASAGNEAHQECWATATVALGRLDPAAARRALASRRDLFLFQVHLRRQLTRLAKGGGPTQQVAAWLLAQMDDRPRETLPPFPPDFGANKPESPAPPTARPATGADTANARW